MTELYHDSARNMLVYRTSNAHHILQHIPDARPVNGSFVCVPNNLGNLQILRLLNLPIVAPMREYDWPIVIGREPCAHQRLMANFMVAHPKSFNLSDPGTMKTLSTLWACDYVMRQYEARGEECRALIVSPLSVMEDAWGSEIARNFLGRRSHRIVYGSADKRMDALRSRADFYLINYDGIGIGADSRSRPLKLGGLSEQLQLRDDIKIVAVDEARNYHDSTTRRHRIARMVFAGKPYLWLLTGTPTPNGPLDAYGQAKLVNGAKGKSMTGWKLETMTQISQFKWVPKRGANERVRELLSPAIRIGIEDVWDGPEMVTETRAVALTEAQRNAMTQLKRDFVVQLGEGRSVSAINEAAVRTKFLQISMGAIYDQNHQWHPIDAGPRKNELLSIVTDAPGKMLVFIPLTSVIRLVYGWLSGYKREIVNGEVSQSDRTRIFRDFQDNPLGTRILLCDPGSVAHGVNLFMARSVVWFGPTDKTELYLQGNKRAHRPGQKFPVTVTRLVSNPLEREIFRRLETNESMQGALLKMIKEGRM
jgi:hypothetical protein